MPIFNTSEKELNFDIPFIELQDYDTCQSINNPTGTRGISKGSIETTNLAELCELQGDLATAIDNPIYYNQASPESTVRTADIIQLRLEHLN